MTALCKPSVSAHGIVSCGGLFVDALATHPPAAIMRVPSGEDQRALPPVATAFSSFDSSRSVRAKKSSPGERAEGVKAPKMYKAGDHVVLQYGSSDDFFSLLVARCDTWSVQWAVGKLPSGYELVGFHAVTAHLVVGTVKSKTNQTELFVASRLDTPLARKSDNRLWRQFVAMPRILNVRLPGQIVAMTAVAATSFAVLTSTGSLHVITVNEDALGARGEGEIVSERTLLSKGLPVSGGAVSLMFAPAENEEPSVLVVWAAGASTVSVVIVNGAIDDSNATAGTAQLSVASKHSVRGAHFCGSSLLCLLLDGPSPALQFATILSEGSGKVDATASGVVVLRYSPVAGIFNSRRNTHTLICTTEPSESANVSADSLVLTTLPMAKGPYTTATSAKSSWRPLNDKFKRYGPRTHTEKSEAAELYRDLQLLGDRTATDGDVAGDLWTPLELAYCLAWKENPQSAEPCELAVFTVKTAPFLHTRLIKQWHNATNGLRQLLKSSTVLRNPLSLSWNPRHLRRTLRLMDQEELAGLFRKAATTARQCAYAEVATSAVDAALQVVTLSRQAGAVLSPKDVETIAVLLRASRAVGHEALQCGNRMELLIGSALQQRRLRRVLEQREEAAESDATEQVAAALPVDFYGLPEELQAMRTLQTRYSANTWTQPLREKLDHHKAVMDKANAYMKETSAAFESGVVASQAPSWADAGARPHEDAMLELFESTLVNAGENGSA